LRSVYEAGMYASLYQSIETHTHMNTKPLIAVVGMDGIFPGAPDLDTFWNNIVEGVNQSAPVPPRRWIAPLEDRLVTDLTPDHPYSPHACLIDDVVFNPDDFSLDPALTRHLDPVLQLTLTAGKRALEGCATAAVDFNRVDTILAAIALPTDSASAFSRKILGSAAESRLFKETPLPPSAVTRADALASRVDGLPAALLAAEMGFGGDSFTLDAACASSIYAVKLACDALVYGRADMVVAGGVSRPECLYTQTGFSQLQALSPSGRCAPFDRRADGLVVGEGVGILVLKRLEDALAHGDAVVGVIHGIGLSNDMRGNLLAPERKGQVRALRQAYRLAGWRPSDVDYIECHGTGTHAGDTTEIESLIELWSQESATVGGCSIGSVKSMIGHLLTAAGAAGMIKTLLAMNHGTLPPSINFEDAPPNSPLKRSPFRVQTHTEAWKTRSRGTPRRAAVSAFGFGGINAHILFEAWPASVPANRFATAGPSAVSGKHLREMEAVAIVGMDLHAGVLNGLSAFGDAVFHGQDALRSHSSQRWKGVDAVFESLLDGIDPKGGFIDTLTLELGEFQIPPNEIDDILPQQLLALKVGAGAITDAGLPLREPRERMGVVMGIGFDFEATNYHLRWQLAGAVKQWNQAHDLKLGPPELAAWLEQLRDGCGPPLTASRVLGSLGGIVASRMAREFRLGGPSFVVSADTATGIKALQVAVDLLRQRAADAMLVGAVDLAGDGRSVVRLDRLLPLSRSNTIRPFDASADGTLPGEGAVALVVKSLSQARKDGDRIYAVISGIGSAGGDDPSADGIGEATYHRSLARCFGMAGTATDSVSYVEANASGIPRQDRVELAALTRFFDAGGTRPDAAGIALGATKPIVGHTGAADALIAVAKTALCLHRRMLPPLVGFSQLPETNAGSRSFHMPRRVQHWYRNRQDGPRRACCASITMDGTCSHVLLEEESDGAEAGQVSLVHPHDARAGLFVVTGESPEALTAGLAEMDGQLKRNGERMPADLFAAQWMARHPMDPDHPLALALILESFGNAGALLNEARQAVASGTTDPHTKAVFHRPHPMGTEARVAMVYPGSGNHYLGMGGDLALRFPSIVADMDRNTAQLQKQVRPWILTPWLSDWRPGWEAQALTRLKADPLNMIFAQVVFGDLMTRILRHLSISADAIIGYSLGESAALFAHGVWPDRGEMLARMQATNLFSEQLAGPCRSLRQAWRIPDGEPAVWRVAVVNRPAPKVRDAIADVDHVRLLIVNTPDECVIGGLDSAVETVIAALDCQAVYLDGVVTVHCDAANPVAQAYRDLHLFPTTAISGLDVYSCSKASAYSVSMQNAADSIEKQAVGGFDFTQTIKRAHADGIRIFIEAGPRGSCTRMIGRILDGETHLAVAANHGMQDENAALLRCLARLVVERVPMDLAPLYAGIDASPESATARKQPPLSIHVGGQAITVIAPPAPPTGDDQTTGSASLTTASRNTPAAPSAGRLMSLLLETARQNISDTASSHERFLDLSRDLTRSYADAFELQNRLLAMGARVKDAFPPHDDDPQPADAPSAVRTRPVAFDRDMCMEFAVGKVGRMLGPAFDEVDTYRVRVRLPDEPLMLVDRILSVEGEMLSMTSGRVVTEHDVHPGAWYLDGDRAPVCISVEAGQADLFLSAYLGIDHQVKGERAYRLLDAEVTFHRGLPHPGNTIRYEIHIDRFVRQGGTWMFFFRFEGYIDDEHLITMRDGCAGFFTEEEVRNSGGIILTEEENRTAPGKGSGDWRPPVPMERESFSSAQVDALRRGDLAGCFGDRFAGIALAPSLRLPDGRMRLIHRILDLDPAGGRYGLGLIRAEADIHPDDWFLTCHFVDDMVMPGTLMYECCAHTLRVFLQRMGWVTDKTGVCYEPVIGNAARLKCRGPVTPQTRHVHYEIQISEIGYAPEPYAIADAHMFADGRSIVFFKDMSIKMTGVTRREIESVWQCGSTEPAEEQTLPLYDRESILAFAVGKPSDAFGDPYRVFDDQRIIARLPGPPYCFMDRVIRVEPPPWELKADGWVTAQVDINPDEWYFIADRSGVMPFCVLLEIALQPCGWLAAYAGSALRSRQDLKFRNLGGNAVLHRQVIPVGETLTMRCRMTKVSEAAEMIIENFDFEVLADNAPVYSGDTYFGFFSAQALGQQKGLGTSDPMVSAMASCGDITDGGRQLDAVAPATPAEASGPTPTVDALALPGKALLMIDRIDAYVEDGGPFGLGYIRGIKQVDPGEWFFKAHFYQDPVCPGSLGLESFLQLMKMAAMEKWPHLAASHRFRLVEGSRHSWSYRGQIVPKNRTVVIEAIITRIEDDPSPSMRADGLLSVDGLPIYKMETFELALVPAVGPAQP
jgi:acyl transferase domain-containing protein/3-hydroxymyristoyl/3-hydroxydecanoyl-(acyl carrier protein) dehydratase